LSGCDSLAILNQQRLMCLHSSTIDWHAQRVSFSTSRLSRHCAMVSPFIVRTMSAICAQPWPPGVR